MSESGVGCHMMGFHCTIFIQSAFTILLINITSFGIKIFKHNVCSFHVIAEFAEELIIIILMNYLYSLCHASFKGALL